MKGKKRERVEYSKKVGLFEGKVVAINPDREKLINLLDIDATKQDDFKDPEYVGLAKDGITATVRVSVWLHDETNDELFNASFFLEDSPRGNNKKDKDGNTLPSDKWQFINCTGTTSWADEKKNLPNWFTAFTDKKKNVIAEKPFRQAYKGEEELMNFVSKWLAFDSFDVDTNILLDVKKLFKGDVKELKEQIGGDLEQKPVFMAIVKTQKKEGEEEKTYQGVYTKDFMYEGSLRYFATPVTAEKIARIEKDYSEGKKLSAQDKFIRSIEDREYGCKDAYFLGKLKDYSPEDFTGDKPKAEVSASDASY